MPAKQMNQLSTLSTLADSDLLLAYDIDEGGSEKTKTITYSEFETQISGAVSSVHNPESLYYNGTDVKATATLRGVSLTDGTDISTIAYAATGGHLEIKNTNHGGSVKIYTEQQTTGTEVLMISADGNSGVSIYHNNGEIFRGQTGGFLLNSGGNQSKFGHEGTYVSIDNYVHGSGVKLTGEDTGGTKRTLIIGHADGAAELYYAGTKMFETVSAGVKIYDDAGAESLQISHSSGIIISYTASINNSHHYFYVKNSGGVSRNPLMANSAGITVRGATNAVALTATEGNTSVEGPAVVELQIFSSTYGEFHIVKTSGFTSFDSIVDSEYLIFTGYNSGSTPTDMMKLDPDGAAELYHAGEKQFETVVSGVEIPEDSFMYFGDTTTAGSWRMGISGDDFIHQKYDGADWVTKQTVVG